MKKILISCMLFVTTALFAGEIQWAHSYKEALTLSKKEKKPIMFIMTKSDCKYCKLLKSTTLKDPKVIARLNKNFINYMVMVDEEGATVPYMLAVYTKGFPTIWFLNEHGQALFQPIGGYMKTEPFLEALDVVGKSYKEYLTKSATPLMKKGK